MRCLATLLLFSLAACSEGKATSCESARAELTSTYHGAARNGYSDGTADVLRAGIEKTMASCNPKDAETATAIAYGYFALEDASSALEALLKIDARNDNEARQKGYELAHLYIFLSREEDAQREVAALRDKFGEHPQAVLASVEYTCKFHRCAYALDDALKLQKWGPSNSLMKLWLGYALADRHEFEKAAEEFDAVVASGDIWTFDPTFAAVAVATYSNTNQKDKASALFRRFSALRYPEGNETDPLRAIMQTIVNDKSDKIYLFSKWPEE